MKIRHLCIFLALAAAVALTGCKSAGQATAQGGGCGGITLASPDGIWGGNYLHPQGLGGIVVGFVQGGYGAFFRCVDNNCNPNFFSALYSAEYDVNSLDGVFTTYNALGPSEGSSPVFMNLTSCLNMQLAGGGTAQQQPTMIMARNDFLRNYGAELDLIQGNWRYEIQGDQTGGDPNTYVLNMSIDVTPGNEIARFAGTDTDGCNYIGDVRIQNPAMNIYTFDDVVLSSSVGTAGCVGGSDETGALIRFEGLYDGLGIMNDINNNPPRQFHVIFYNGERAFSVIFIRTA